jgi:acyl carrier protein
MEQRLISVLSSTLALDESQITIDSSSENIEQWDSLKHMNIIFAVEDEFNIIIPDEKLSESTNVKALLAIIKEAK